jgi:hypothetical protein
MLRDQVPFASCCVTPGVGPAAPPSPTVVRRGQFLIFQGKPNVLLNASPRERYRLVLVWNIHEMVE